MIGSSASDTAAAGVLKASPSSHKSARSQQHHTQYGCHDGMFDVDMGNAGLVTGQEPRQLIGRHQEIDCGDNEQENAEYGQSELHGDLSL
jgi:hypothetical protein